MRARDYLEETWEALDANRGRSLLTILGIVIGIAAVITMTALIGGIRQSILGQIGANQARLVYLNVFTDTGKLDDAALDEMREDIPDLESTSPLARSYIDIGSGQDAISCSITGVDSDYFAMSGMKLVAGRFFNSNEDKEASSVILLDEEGAHRLFGTDAQEAIGQSVRLGSTSFTAIGVIETQYAGSGSVEAYMPSKTLVRAGGYSDRSSAVALAREGADMDQVVSDVTSWLKTRFRISDDEADSYIYVYSLQSTIDQVNSVMMSFQVLMTAVASIALLVGGIGIMNMMLTNVTERIREIGLRKALGATSSDIAKQFLLESISLCITGGVFGIILGYLGAFVVAGLAGSFFSSAGLEGLTPAIDPVSVIVAAGICILIGIIFGYGPARRAARLDPIEALRYQ